MDERERLIQLQLQLQQQGTQIDIDEAVHQSMSLDRIKQRPLTEAEANLLTYWQKVRQQ